MRTLILGVLLLSLGTQSLAQSIALPDMGDPSQQVLGPQDERRIGQRILMKLQDAGLVLEDPLASEYLASLGSRLALHADGAGSPLRFFWVRDPELNAFALPGGFIGVHTGLMLETRSESELAGVVAHEIAHVVQHHITRAYADRQTIGLPTMAAMLAGIALAAAGGGGGQIGQAVAVGSMAASAQRIVNFTRANEQEADRVGTDLLIRAGFEPNGMASFFGRLENLSGSAAQIPEFLRTHPLALNRAADTENRSLRTRPTGRTPGDELYYRYMRARIAALSVATPAQAVRDHERRTAEGGTDETDRYGYVLALERAGRLDDAARELAKLPRPAAAALALRLEEARLALLTGNAARAWSTYEALRRAYGNDYVLALSYGEALVTRGDPRLAIRLLDEQLRRRPESAELQELYARAAEQTGDIAGKHLAMSQFYELSGDVQAAFDQAEIGLRAPNASGQQLAQLRQRAQRLRELNEYEKASRLPR